jgi:uncharacterized protein (TIGR03067 family)
MRLLATFAAVVVVGPFPGIEPGDKAAEILKKLDGTWTYESLEKGGKKDDDLARGMVLTIKDGSWKLTIFGSTGSEGTLKVDTSKKPMIWVKSFKDSKGGAEVMKAIFELDGDTLRCCESGLDKDAPKDFKSPQGSMDQLATLKRKK